MEPLNLHGNISKVSPPLLKTAAVVFHLFFEHGEIMKNVSPLAGKPTGPSMRANIPRLVTAYYTNRPDPSVPEQRVAFGTSGHRGSSLKHSFNEAPILATTQAICLYRQQQHIDGPLFLSMDTHALSNRPWRVPSKCWPPTAVVVMVDRENGYTPSPVISHAILTYNRDRKTGLADGIVITPSHNPSGKPGTRFLLIPALKIPLRKRGTKGDLSASSAFVMPDFRYRASTFVFRMDPRFHPAGMTEWGRHARHPLSGIHLRFSDGSPLPTRGDDDWNAFGVDHLLKGI
jgi:hypothetical protein